MSGPAPQQEQGGSQQNSEGGQPVSATEKLRELVRQANHQSAINAQLRESR
jgi:hypothetical protein